MTELSKVSKKSSGTQKKDYSAMFRSLIDVQEFTGRAGTEGKLDFNAISRKLYESEIKLAGISDRAKAKRSASYITAEDTSISSLFEDLNNCLLGLIKAMPEDFKEFSMAEWLEKYKCSMQVYIESMKFISTYANSNVSMIRTMVILMIMCLLFDVIRFFAIYPYITIRTLNDTLQERIDRLAASLEFSNFQKEHPGMEHKAGVAVGETLLLVYQNGFEGWSQDDEKVRKLLKRLSEKKLIGYDQKLELKGPDPKKITKALQEMEGMVVADFTLPYLCCDECGNLPHTPLPLDPLVTPICGIVSFDDQKFSSYRMFTKKMLNNLYDPAVYKVKLISNPEFGTATLSETTYLPDPSKMGQLLNYEVNLTEIEKEKTQNDDYILIDEFYYEVTDNTRNEIVGKDKIILFIPITRKEQITVRGKVTARDVNGNTGLAGAQVVVKGTAIGTIARFDGTYDLENVPEGALVNASFLGYLDQSKEVQAGDTLLLNFVLETAPFRDIDYDRQFKALDIEPETPQAKQIQDYFSSRMGNYIQEIEKIKKRIGRSGVTAISKARKAISEFSDEKEINIVRLNNDYNSLRNDLIRGWEKSSGQEKELYAEALQNLTNAYLERLAFTQPGKLTNTSKDVLKETGSIINDNEGLHVKESVQNWLNHSEGYVSNDYRANIKRYMNIK